MTIGPSHTLHEKAPTNMLGGAAPGNAVFPFLADPMASIRAEISH